MNHTTLLTARNLTVHFPVSEGFIKDLRRKRNERKVVKAVDGVDITLERGKILSLVGESGSGKTTTGRALLNLIPQAAGELSYAGQPYQPSSRTWIKDFRQKAQMIFQDPYQALNPRYMIIDIVAEPLLFAKEPPPFSELEGRVIQALEFAGIKPGRDFLYRYPHELSGGQRQRVALAAIFTIEPEFIVADEPVSMLDASIRADIVKLMFNMKEEKGASFLFITHDLSLAWLISDEIAIMYLGKIVEKGSAEIISGGAIHPYSQALMSVLANLDLDRPRKKIILKGETPSPINIPQGCRFNNRCPLSRERCRAEEPPLTDYAQGHSLACFFPEKIV